MEARKPPYSPKMAVLTGNQDETSQPRQPQQGNLAVPPEAHRAESSMLPGAASVSLPDPMSVVTPPSMVTPKENDSSTNLLSSSEPLANSTSSRPSLVSLDEPRDSPSSTEVHGAISVKPSSTSLPESPKAPMEERISPVQSTATVPDAEPVSPAKATESSTVPLAPAPDPGKWQTKIKGYKRSLGDFSV